VLPRNAALVAFACVAVPAIGGYLAFRSQRWLLDAATPGLGLLALFVALLVLTLRDSTRQKMVLERVVQSSRERDARISGELEAAQRVQVGMLPAADRLRGDRRMDLAATMAPAREVGGDLYDFFLLDDRRLFLLIGDVAGKGLSASIFMAVSKALYKSVALRASDPDIGALMSAANLEVSRDNPEALFVTAFAAILDLDSGELEYCNAGHEIPYLCGSQAIGRIEDSGGPPLCVVDDFEYRAAHRRMRTGEVLCLITDGVIDAQNPAGEFYGRERAEQCLKKLAQVRASARDIVATLCADVASFTASAETFDDLTVIALRWNGPPEAGPTSIASRET
jgi:serine phosphatase RsbU (regulator of sigma subunit)